MLRLWPISWARVWNGCSEVIVRLVLSGLSNNTWHSGGRARGGGGWGAEQRHQISQGGGRGSIMINYDIFALKTALNIVIWTTGGGGVTGMCHQMTQGGWRGSISVQKVLHNIWMAPNVQHLTQSVISLFLVQDSIHFNLCLIRSWGPSTTKRWEPLIEARKVPLTAAVAKSPQVPAMTRTTRELRLLQTDPKKLRPKYDPLLVNPM